MSYQRIRPDSQLSQLIECYWQVDDPSTTPALQKIIPDGFPEIIFHFGAPYRIRIESSWDIQAMNLVGGQIDRHVMLGNTGASDILAVKLRPATLTKWFGISMDQLTNRVVNLLEIWPAHMSSITQAIRTRNSHPDRVQLLNDFFRSLPVTENGAVDQALEVIFNNHGMISVADLTREVGVGERQLQHLFRRFVGLSPKRYARVIRFNYIFECIRKGSKNGSDLAFEAAFYDQSHFIRSFRDFTGENPGEYGFDQKNLANFFLMKGS